MTRMARTIVMVILASAAALTATPVTAHDARRDGFAPPPASVFPAPRDPWRSWGLRTELPHGRLVPPRVHGGGAVVAAPEPGAFWVPGQWVWDGATWVWWHGHWVR